MGLGLGFGVRVRVTPKRFTPTPDLQEALEARAAVLRPLALVAVRAQHDEAALHIYIGDRVRA